jgi:hypothetical protein
MEVNLGSFAVLLSRTKLQHLLRAVGMLILNFVVGILHGI